MQLSQYLWVWKTLHRLQTREPRLSGKSLELLHWLWTDYDLLWGPHAFFEHWNEFYFSLAPADNVFRSPFKAPWVMPLSPKTLQLTHLCRKSPRHWCPMMSQITVSVSSFEEKLLILTHQDWTFQGKHTQTHTFIPLNVLSTQLSEFREHILWRQDSIISTLITKQHQESMTWRAPTSHYSRLFQ